MTCDLEFRPSAQCWPSTVSLPRFPRIRLRRREPTPQSRLFDLTCAFPLNPGLGIEEGPWIHSRGGEDRARPFDRNNISGEVDYSNMSVTSVDTLRTLRPKRSQKSLSPGLLGGR